MSINTDIEDNAYPSAATRLKIEELERAHAAQERRDKIAKDLSDFIQTAESSEIVALANELAHDHRTLVQRKFGFFLAFTKVLARNYNDGNYDLRNEYAVKTSVKIMEIVIDSGVPNV